MADVEIVVVYVMRGKRGRIISARRAHRDERKDYANHLRDTGKRSYDLKRLRAMRDADIDFSDIPKLGKSFWKTASPCPNPRIASQSELTTTSCSG
jgi:hypothetical protein